MQPYPPGFLSQSLGIDEPPPELEPPLELEPDPALAPELELFEPDEVEPLELLDAEAAFVTTVPEGAEIACHTPPSPWPATSSAL